MVRRLAFWTIPIAFGVMGLKFAAWWLTGSVALLSDALESIVNVVAAVVVYSTVWYAQRPADDSHPFGHHKAEYFSAVTEGVLIVLAAILIISEALPALRDPTFSDAPLPGMAVNLLAAAVNAGWATVLVRAGRAARSPALVADGKHIWSDVVTSVGVLVGLGLALATGWLILDPLMAILVALNILREGWKVIGGSVHGLMDRALDGDEIATVSQTIRDHAGGAIEFHDLKTRAAGPARFVEFHLIVPSDMTVSAAHAICDRIEEGLRAAFPGVRTTIHVEPAHKAKPEVGVSVTP